MSKQRLVNRTLHLRSLLHRLPIRRQLLLVYFVAGILPILLVGGYLLLNTRQLVMTQHQDQAAADKTRVRSVLLDTTISLSNIADDFFNDRDLTELLSQTYATDEDAYTAMRDYTKAVNYSVNYTEIESLTLYFQNATMRDYGHFKRLGEAESQTAWFQAASGSAGYHWMTVSRKDKWGNELHEMTLLRRIPVLKRGEIAILAIAVNRNYLKSRIETSQLKTEVAVNNDPLFYSNLRKEAGQAFGIAVPQGDKFYRMSGILPYAGQDEALVQVSTVLPIKSQDRLLIATIDPEAVPGTLRILLTSGAILLFALGLPVLAQAPAPFDMTPERGNEQPPTSNGRDPDALDREADKVRAEEVRLVDQVRLAEAALTEASSRRDEAESAEASAARSYASQLRAVADRREGLARLTGQVDSLRSRLEAGSEEEARLRARLTEAVARAEDAERQFTQLETRLTGVTDGESDLDTGYERAAEAQAAAESELERLRAAERAAEQRSATLRARIEALQVGLQRRDASGALLNDGELPGLLGSLASMVSIEPEWQTAVSAALGAATEALAVCAQALRGELLSTSEMPNISPFMRSEKVISLPD